YPNKAITETVRTKAAKAAKTVDKTSAPPSQKWKLVGPNGVPASALVASESTNALTGTIFSGRATAIAVAPNCSAASCTVFIAAALHSREAQRSGFTSRVSVAQRSRQQSFWPRTSSLLTVPLVATFTVVGARILSCIGLRAKRRSMRHFSITAFTGGRTHRIA